MFFNWNKRSDAGEMAEQYESEVLLRISFWRTFSSSAIVLYLTWFTTIIIFQRLTRDS